MNRGLLAPLQRRARQAETLRKMLADVKQLEGLAQKITNERELTGDEQREVAELAVRRERIEKSIAEAGA